MPDDSDHSSLESQDRDIPMPAASRYAGENVDASSRHSIAIVSSGDDSERDSPVDPASSHSVVDYFYHDGQYWRAVIPLDGVDKIYGQAFNFSNIKTREGADGPEILFNKNGLPRRSVPILNHIQTRFHFKADQPVELYPLGKPTSGDAVHRCHDIIYSFEAVGPVGITFSVRDGLAGNLISTHRFISLQEMVFERLVVENQWVAESPPLPLSEQETRALLVGSLLRSHRAGMTERYYLYRICGTNNCTSSPLQIVDRVVHYGWLQRLGSMIYRLPLSPRFYLRIRGLDSDPSFRKLLRSEFETYIQDEETQTRKREHVRKLASIRRAAKEARAGTP